MFAEIVSKLVNPLIRWYYLLKRKSPAKKNKQNKGERVAKWTEKKRGR